MISNTFFASVAPGTVAPTALVLFMPKALRSAVHECQQRLRSQIVAPMTAAPKILVFSRPVALRSAVHERQRLRSQLLSNASNSDDSGSEDTGLLNASSSECQLFTSASSGSEDTCLLKVSSSEVNCS